MNHESVLSTSLKPCCYCSGKTHTHTPTPSNPKIKEENSQTHTHKTGTKLIVPFRLYFKASGRETYPGVTFVILFCVHEEFIGCIRWFCLVEAVVYYHCCCQLFRTWPKSGLVKLWSLPLTSVTRPGRHPQKTKKSAFSPLSVHISPGVAGKLENQKHIILQ